MDEKDRQIIWALQKDGRLSNQDLSEKVALSPSPCLRRLRLLEEAKIIKGYTAIVDEEAQGMRALYVALTRATKRLAIVHARDLPDALR